MNYKMDMSQNIALNLELKQILSPLMIQSLQMLNLPYQQLNDQIVKEAEENVVIDVSSQDELISYIKDSMKSIPSLKAPGEDSFSYLDSVKASEGSLYDHLMVQLELEYLDNIDFEICQKLIEQINERGFIENFSTTKKELIKSYSVKETRVKKCLSIIQSFEPAGVGARNVKESLLLQINAHSFEEDLGIKELLVEVVKDYLEPLARRNFDDIALDLMVDVEDIELVAEFIQNNLTPTPAENYIAPEVQNYIVPSFEIRKEGDDYIFINLEKTKGIRINFNLKYLEMLKDPSLDEKTREFISQKLQKAKQFRDMINRRNEMMDSVGNIILDRQRDYFDKGIHYLMPISQKEISELVDVHPSTISRAISSKYVITPVGILPLKYLCPRQVSGVSTQRIKFIINDIISIDPDLSDIKIASQLEKSNIFIKRRTVAKYRSQMRLSNSYNRGTD